MTNEEWMKEAERLVDRLVSRAYAEYAYGGGPLATKYRGEREAAQSILRAHLQHLPLTGREATDEAEFEIHCNGDCEASAWGPREQAWREIQHYAALYRQHGQVVIYEVTRTKVSPSTDKEGGGEGGADGVAIPQTPKENDRG